MLYVAPGVCLCSSDRFLHSLVSKLILPSKPDFNSNGESHPTDYMSSTYVRVVYDFEWPSVITLSSLATDSCTSCSVGKFTTNR